MKTVDRWRWLLSLDGSGLKVSEGSAREGLLSSADVSLHSSFSSLAINYTGDDWRIDWVGKWSPVGVDAEGFLYTDSDWQGPSPYPYGHPNQPKYPPSQMNNFHLKQQGIDDDSDHLTGMEIRNAKSDTRRRRWLRRATYVGKEE